MGRLIGYGLGEVIDRLSILSLKILHGEEAGKDCAHFLRERHALMDASCARLLCSIWSEVLVHAVVDLTAVNGTLWSAEDYLRSLRESVSESVVAKADIAIHIQALNDRRSLLIDTINKATGDTGGPEKLT